MSEYFVQKDGKVRQLSEQQLREQLRKNKYTGLELVRRFDQSQWIPLHDTPMFVQEVPFQGAPVDAARWRTGKGFLVHAAVFLGVNAMIGAAPVFFIWGIFVVLHGTRAVPPLLALYREGKIPGLGGKNQAALGQGQPPAGASRLGTPRPITAPQQPVAGAIGSGPAALGPAGMSPPSTGPPDPHAPTAHVVTPPTGVDVASPFDPTVGPPAPVSSSSVEDRQLRQSVRSRLFGDEGADPVRVGRYRLDERIGAGGMGVVFRAHDEQLDRPVAVKLLKPGYDTEMGTERLQREARAMARVSHPNVVTVHDVGIFEESVFVAMEYVDGPTLRDWLAEPRSVGDIVGVLRQAAEGMAAAHRAGLIHRDFKPENIIVGSDQRVRVLDFGLAKPLESSDAPDFITRTGTVMGTPRYMAPEQFRGEPADVRTDQFALGVVLYEAIYGMHPYEPTDERSLPQSVLAGQRRQPNSRADVTAAIRDAILKAVAADPQARHPDLPAMIESFGPVPATSNEFATLAATVRRLLHRHSSDNKKQMLTALDDIERVVAELDAKAAMLAEQTRPRDVEQLQSEKRQAETKLDELEDDGERRLVQSQLSALDQRLAGIERAREVIERLRTRRSVAENQLKQLHLDLTRAEAAQTALPDLTDPLQELRYEVDAAQEVEALLGR